MNWDEYWYEMCNTVSLNSKCLSRKIGVVIVKEGKFFVSSGYNGAVMGAPHCDNIDYRVQLFRKFMEENPDKVIQFMETDSKVIAETDEEQAVLDTGTCPRRFMGFDPN